MRTKKRRAPWREARRAAGRRVAVVACRTYLGTWMEPNRFRTASVALAVAVTAAGAAAGATIALLTGTQVPTGANLGILVTTGTTSLMLLTMLLIMLMARRSGRSPDDLIADRIPPGHRATSYRATSYRATSYRATSYRANTVRPMSPPPAHPLVPLALPWFFTLLAALLGGEALWSTDRISYWWAGGSCLVAAVLTWSWRTAGRRTDRAVH